MTEPTKLRAVDTYVASLFQHGLEGYDKDQKETPTKGITNPGGAKVFFHINWKGPQSPITINHPEFKKVLHDLPIVFYTLSRIELDEEGNPKHTKDGISFNRINTGLMLYMQFSDSPANALGARKRILEAMKPTVDLSNYIEVASRIHDPEGRLKILTTLENEDFTRTRVPLRLDAAIIINLPSGAPGSSMFWSFSNKKTTSRVAMNNALSANPLEQEGLPL